MEYSILLFGITKEIFDAPSCKISGSFDTVGALRERLYKDFPALQKLNSLMIAVNRKYADDKAKIHAEDEIALIPPVSGG